MERITNATKCSNPVFGISKVFSIVLPVAQIAVGVKYLNECPVQEKIPIYLIVSGVFSITLSLLLCLPCTQNSKDDEPKTMLGQIFTVWNSLVFMFLSCWFLAGNVWIYSVYKPDYNKNTTAVNSYCNKTLYEFAFWTTTLAYILLLLFIVIGCLVLVSVYLCRCADPDDHINSDPSP